LYRESWARQPSAAQVRGVANATHQRLGTRAATSVSCSTVMLGACPGESKPTLVCAPCRLAGWTAGCHAHVLGRSDLAGLLTTAGTTMAGDRDQGACASSARSLSSATATDHVARSPDDGVSQCRARASCAVLSHVSRNDSTIGRLGIPAMSARPLYSSPFPQPIRRAESLDVSSFAAQDACAARATTTGQAFAVSGRLARSRAAYRSSRRDGGGGSWGVHAWP
jgi:hypothetical protein